jgi:PRC-barrel domain protein
MTGTPLAPAIDVQIESRLRHLDAGKVDTPIGKLDDVTVVGPSHDPLGRLEGIIVDPAERHVRYYVVESRGWLKTHRYLVPDAPRTVDWEHKTLQVELDAAALSHLPELHDEDFPALCDEDLRSVA